MNVAAEKSAPAPPAANTARSRRFHEFGGWTRLIQILLLLSIGLSIVAIGLIAGIFQDASALTGPNVAGLKQKLAVLTIVRLGHLVPGAIAGLALLAWIYMAYANLPALDAGSMRFSPPIALLLCLIPVLNIVTIYILLGEIWRESDPGRLNPAGRSRPSGVTVSFWFLATLLTLCAAGYDYWMATQGPQPPDLFEATFVGIWVNALHIMQSLLLLWIVGTIWVNQVERRSLALQPRKSIAVTRVPEFPGAANEGGLP